MDSYRSTEGDRTDGEKGWGTEEKRRLAGKDWGCIARTNAHVCSSNVNQIQVISNEHVYSSLTSTQYLFVFRNVCQDCSGDEMEGTWTLQSLIRHCDVTAGERCVYVCENAYRFNCIMSARWVIQGISKTQVCFVIEILPGSLPRALTSESQCFSWNKVYARITQSQS